MSWTSSSPSGSTTTTSALTSPLETPTSSTRPPSSQQSPKSQSEEAESQPSNTSANGNQSTSEQSKERVTVPSACVACRSKHLKCDGLSPCTRCSANSKKPCFLVVYHFPTLHTDDFYFELLEICERYICRNKKLLIESTSVDFISTRPYLYPSKMGFMSLNNIKNAYHA
jgi:hypothetical protein